jgi:hypothetical protein
VQTGKPLPESSPEVPGWLGLMDPLQHQHLPFIQSGAGHCEWHAEDGGVEEKCAISLNLPNHRLLSFVST